MTNIKALYDNPEVNSGQRDYFWEKVSEILIQQEKGKIFILKESLRYMYQRYDCGGHSCGRSMRSLLLEEAMRDIRSEDFESAGKIFSIIVAMYHNHEYIEKHGWYDFKMDFGLYGSSIDERIHLSVLAFLTGVENEIPDISNFTKQDFLAFLK